ncbi:MAG: UDP-3-O-acyl-N-acetylglucosamine deacetylase, partial [Planctomycetota bacterium]
MGTTPSQRTIAGPAVVRGFGYWDGQDVCVEFRPATVDTGIVFVRKDLPGCPRLRAHVAHRVERPRRTTLRSGTTTV